MCALVPKKNLGDKKLFGFQGVVFQTIKPVLLEFLELP